MSLSRPKRRRVRARLAIRALAVGLSAVWLSVAAAQDPWINAGDQASLMHQHALQRAQTSSQESQEASPDEARKREAPVDSAGDGAAVLETRAEVEAELRRMARIRQKQLAPEYNRRLERDGREAANAWLRKTATELGRRDGKAIRARMR